MPSERSFGLLFTAVFAGLGVLGIWKGRHVEANAAWLAAGAVVGLLTFVAPAVLAPFNRAWLRLGELMSKVVSPVVLGVLFFGILTPVALLGRLFGRDELRLKRPNLPSYWIDRQPIVTVVVR
jgi:hypothetical protein